MRYIDVTLEVSVNAGRVPALLAMAVAVAGLIFVTASPTLADPPECDPYIQCDDPADPLPPDGYEPNPCIEPWQQVYVGADKEMGSCLYAFDGATLSVKTSMWGGVVTGFHGCVKGKFVDAYGGLVFYTPQHSWGVDAGDYREVHWTAPGPGVPWDHLELMHWRC
jgi:hypothetical protein